MNPKRGGRRKSDSVSVVEKKVGTDLAVPTANTITEIGSRLSEDGKKMFRKRGGMSTLS